MSIYSNEHAWALNAPSRASTSHNSLNQFFANNSTSSGNASETESGRVAMKVRPHLRPEVLC